MTATSLPAIDQAELAACVPDPEAGFGSLRTAAGNLPLRQLAVRARLVGLASRVLLTQRFLNPHAEPLEATYVFPLPDRGAVTDLRMTADGRTVVARLREREQARREYEEAVAAGRRASIAEEERPDVFTIRVGNILPGEEVTVELTVIGVLPVLDGEATFRFPLVVAPRYIPGGPLPGEAVGEGWQPDTDAVPDASRISPPVLLPGFPNPVQLDLEVDLDPAGLEMGVPRSSLHAVQVEAGRIRFEPGSRPDRDIVLRIPLGRSAGPSAGLSLAPDTNGTEGTFELTVLPPDLAHVPRPRDVVLLLDRSGSMAGWKMVAARRAAARIVDTLTDHDRFAVIAFDDRVETPGGLPAGLAPATDRHRFRAVEFLAGLQARGGTELSEPLGRGLDLLAREGVPDHGAADVAVARRDPVLVLVTDGQVGNEDQLLSAHGGALGSVRIHTVGIDKAVNAGFLGRLASLGGGRCELVESEDRLDEAMSSIHRRIGSPLVSQVVLDFAGLDVVDGSITPARLPDVFPGVPHVVRGRYRSAAAATAVLRGRAPDGAPFAVEARGTVVHEPAITAAWARARLRDLEDGYAARLSGRLGLGTSLGADDLERRIVSMSLEFGVLCRFTAFVAVDDRVVTDGSPPRSIIQPVALPSGWEMPVPAGAAPRMAAMRFAAAPMAVLPATAGSASAPVGGAPASADGRPVGVGARPAIVGGRPHGRTDQGGRWLRILLATEAGRLRALAREPEHRRHEALLDLSSRLIALEHELRDSAWRELIDRLRPERLAADPLADTWDVILRLLDELAADGTAVSTKPARGSTPRSTFWKRR